MCKVWFSKLKLFLIVPEQPHWALNTKMVIIHIKIYARMQQRLKFNMKLQIQFKKNAVFLSCNIFSMLMVSVWVCIHFSLLDTSVLSFNIWRQKHESISSSHLKPLFQYSLSPIMFPNIKKDFKLLICS